MNTDSTSRNDVTMTLDTDSVRADVRGLEVSSSLLDETSPEPSFPSAPRGTAVDATVYCHARPRPPESYQLVLDRLVLGVEHGGTSLDVVLRTTDLEKLASASLKELLRAIQLASVDGSHMIRLVEDLAREREPLVRANRVKQYVAASGAAGIRALRHILAMRLAPVNARDH